MNPHQVPQRLPIGFWWVAARTLAHDTYTYHSLNLVLEHSRSQHLTNWEKKKSENKHSIGGSSKIQMLLQMFLPTLRGLTTACLTLGCPEGPRVTALFAVPICICCPVASNALSIYPDLALAHATHIQSQWLISAGSLEVSLRSRTVVRIGAKLSHK